MTDFTGTFSGSFHNSRINPPQKPTQSEYLSLPTTMLVSKSEMLSERMTVGEHSMKS